MITFLEVWAAVATTWVALRLAPRQIAAYALDVPRCSTEAVDGEIIRRFTAITRPIARGRCLVLSIALVQLLRRRGSAAVLRIGFECGGDSLPGHAWVECDGVPQGNPDTIRRKFIPFNVTDAGIAAFLSRKKIA